MVAPLKLSVERGGHLSHSPDLGFLPILNRDYPELAQKQKCGWGEGDFLNPPVELNFQTTGMPLEFEDELLKVLGCCFAVETPFSSRTWRLFSPAQKRLHGETRAGNFVPPREAKCSSQRSWLLFI